MTRRRRQHPAEQDEQRQPDELDPARNLDPRRRAGGSVHAIDRTTGPPQRPRRAPVWDWAFAEDGSLALDRPEAWDDPRTKPLHPVAHGYAVEGPPGVRYGPADVAAPGLRARLASPCPSPQLEARRRRLAVLVAVAVVIALTRARDRVRRRRRIRPPRPSTPPSASRLLPAGPPTPQVISRLGTLDLQLPINQSRVTAIGYSGGADGALALAPGRRAGERGAASSGSCTSSSAAAPARRAGTSSRAAPGPPTSALDVGAAPGDGRLLAGRRHDRRHQQGRAERPRLRPADRHPADRRAVARRLGLAPAPDPSLEVGAVVTGGQLEARPGARPLEGRGAGARALHERRGQPRAAGGSPGGDASRCL